MLPFLDDADAIGFLPTPPMQKRIWLDARERRMKRLVEIRNQEFICRERAMLDREHRLFWLAQAEEWEQRALDEIAFQFRGCNPDDALPRAEAG